MVFSGRAHPELADEVSEMLGSPLVPTTAYEFANSEIYVRYEESVRGSDAFVLQSHTAPINEWIMEHLIMVDALKRASAKRITVVMPFYGYARQDKKHRGREPISARLMADLFKTAGADRLIVVDLHADQIQGFFDGPVDHLMALPILAYYVREKYGDQKLAVVSPGRRPDQGGRALVGPARGRAAGLHPQDPAHRPAQRGRRQPRRGSRRGPDVRARRRHDRHRRHDRGRRGGADEGRRQGRHHRGDPPDPERPRRRPSQEQPRHRGGGHQHARR